MLHVAVHVPRVQARGLTGQISGPQSREAPLRNIILAVVLCTATTIGLPNATDLAAQTDRQAGDSPDSGDTADAVSIQGRSNTS